MRLAKFLAHAGVASRRAAEGIIREGRVTVGREIVLDPARDVDEHDDVRVDGAAVALEAEHVVYLVNKPAGVVSTAKDTHGRPVVTELVDAGVRLYPVGRLDADTTGLILLTNDGELANRLMHPRYELEREYSARVHGNPDLELLRRGVPLEDGVAAFFHIGRAQQPMVHRPIVGELNFQLFALLQWPPCIAGSVPPAGGETAC
jgi:23S rRNA pseudouridine2605 synthase